MKNRSRVIFILILCVLLCSNNGFNFGLRIHDMGFTYHFNPAKISDLALWLDASDSSSITLNGSNVSQWNDKSGNNYSAVQNTSTDQPLYVATGLNGNPTIRFPKTGGTQALTIFGGIDISSNTARALFMVLNPKSGYGDNQPFGTSTLQMIDFGTYTSNNRIRVRNDSNIFSAADSVAYDSPHIITVTDDSTNNLNAWNDGTQILTNETRTFNWTLSENLGIGWAMFEHREFNGDISEIIIYSRELSTSERERVEAYLNDKWGI